MLIFSLQLTKSRHISRWDSPPGNSRLCLYRALKQTSELCLLWGAWVPSCKQTHLLPCAFDQVERSLSSSPWRLFFPHAPESVRYLFIICNNAVRKDRMDPIASREWSPWYQQQRESGALIPTARQLGQGGLSVQSRAFRLLPRDAEFCYALQTLILVANVAMKTDV